MIRLSLLAFVCLHFSAMAQIDPGAYREFYYLEHANITVKLDYSYARDTVRINTERSVYIDTVYFYINLTDFNTSKSLYNEYTLKTVLRKGKDTVSVIKSILTPNFYNAIVALRTQKDTSIHIHKYATAVDTLVVVIPRVAANYNMSISCVTKRKKKRNRKLLSSIYEPIFSFEFSNYRMLRFLRLPTRRTGGCIYCPNSNERNNLDYIRQQHPLPVNELIIKTVPSVN